MTKTTKNIENEKMPFTQHLEELRKRLIIIFISIGFGFILTYFLSHKIILILKIPLGQDLIFISPTEAFFVNLKVALFASLFLTIPITLYQLWRFVSPGLLEKEKKHTLPFVVSSTIMFVIGGMFAYYLILPFGIKFLLAYGTNEIKPMLSLGNYISFTTKLILAFGIVFELPLVLLFLTKIGIITPKFLTRNRKYAILLVFIIAAFLTPPDVFTQILMALPLIVLYEVSILLSKLVYKKKGDDEV